VGVTEEVEAEQRTAERETKGETPK